MAADEIDNLADAVRPYVDLLRSFVAGRMGAEDFSNAFMNQYLTSNAMHSEDVFNRIDGFFADAESYVDDPTLRDPRHDIGPEELLDSTRALLRDAGFADD